MIEFSSSPLAYSSVNRCERERERDEEKRYNILEKRYPSSTARRNG